jgi:hypothetical protein
MPSFCLEPTSHELRQAITIAAPVLQEGNYEEDGAKPTASLPVLPSLLSVACLFNQTSQQTSLQQNKNQSETGRPAIVFMLFLCTTSPCYKQSNTRKKLVLYGWSSC